ncbi:MAG TPA: shikimate kinase, partial [Candidatus Berkiella sp.]|nr:shikimate kinase [Candidatus Berkiella sp.]
EALSMEGEKSFQHCLSAILTHQISKENVVVTTDDSIILNEENRQKLSSQFTVYADVSTTVQFDRISQNRPLLPVDDYKAFLENLHKERDGFYEEVASLEILTDDGDLDGHVSRIIEAIEQ